MNFFKYKSKRKRIKKYKMEEITKHYQHLETKAMILETHYYPVLEVINKTENLFWIDTLKEWKFRSVQYVTGIRAAQIRHDIEWSDTRTPKQRKSYIKIIEEEHESWKSLQEELAWEFSEIIKF